MLPSIDTLVEDIVKLVESDDHTVSEESKRKLGSSLADTIVSNLFNDRKSQENRGALRLSALGAKCNRQLWYKEYMGDTGEKLTYSTRLKFLFGHILEDLLRFLVEESGHSVTKRQEKLVLDGVAGHRDAVIDGVQTDVKSASTRGFDKFKSHNLENDDPFGYIEQNTGYYHADPELRNEEVAFLAIDRQFGHVCLDKYPVRMSRTDIARVVDEKKRALASKVPPNRAFMPVPEGKSGNLKLPMECSYCDHKFNCYPNLRTFLYAKGPVFLTHVAKEPDVKEIVRGEVPGSDGEQNT